MTEFECVGQGYSIEDEEVDQIFENYSSEKTIYLVILHNGKLAGGGGIGPLSGGDATTCELKKMYFLPELRGKGMGKQLLDLLLKRAKEMGFQQCYLETVKRMNLANKLYQKSGFKALDQPLGSTGHSSCDSYYLLEL